MPRIDEACRETLVSAWQKNPVMNTGRFCISLEMSELLTRQQDIIERLAAQRDRAEMAGGLLDKLEQAAGSPSFRPISLRNSSSPNGSIRSRSTGMVPTQNSLRSYVPDISKGKK